MSEAKAQSQGLSWTFAILVYFIFIYGIGLKSSSLSLLSPKLADEVFAIMIFLPTVVHLITDKTSVYSKYCISFFSIFIAIGLITSGFQDVDIYAIGIQLISSIKIIGFLFFPILFLPANKSKEGVMSFFYYTLIFTTLASEIFRIIMPDVYWGLFDGLTHVGALHLGNSLLQRAYGIFLHPSQLVMVTGCVLIYYLGKCRFLALLPLILIMISTAQLFEMSFYVALLAYFSWGNPVKRIKLMFISLFVFLLGTALLNSAAGINILSPVLELSFIQDQEARVVFLTNGFRLALENFPFGLGFGSFGGVGAKLYNQDVYNALSFSNYWWFRSGEFQTDTALANFIGEVGYAGIFAIYGCILFFALFAMNLAEDRGSKRKIALVVSHITILTVAGTAIFDVTLLSAVGICAWCLTSNGNEKSKLAGQAVSEQSDPQRYTVNAYA